MRREVRSRTEVAGPPLRPRPAAPGGVGLPRRVGPHRQGRGAGPHLPRVRPAGGGGADLGPARRPRPGRRWPAWCRASPTSTEGRASASRRGSRPARCGAGGPSSSGWRRSCGPTRRRRAAPDAGARPGLRGARPRVGGGRAAGRGPRATRTCRAATSCATSRRSSTSCARSARWRPTRHRAGRPPGGRGAAPRGRVDLSTLDEVAATCRRDRRCRGPTTGRGGPVGDRRGRAPAAAGGGSGGCPRRAVTVRKGEAWGEAAGLPAGGVVVPSDAEAAPVVDAARRAAGPCRPGAWRAATCAARSAAGATSGATRADAAVAAAGRPRLGPRSTAPALVRGPPGRPAVVVAGAGGGGHERRVPRRMGRGRPRPPRRRPARRARRRRRDVARGPVGRTLALPTGGHVPHPGHRGQPPVRRSRSSSTRPTPVWLDGERGGGPPPVGAGRARRPRLRR